MRNVVASTILFSRKESNANRQYRELLKAFIVRGTSPPRTMAICANRREADGWRCHVTGRAVRRSQKAGSRKRERTYLPSCGTDMYVSQSTKNCPICTAPRATTLLVRNSIVCGPVRFSIIGNCCNLSTRALTVSRSWIKRFIWSRRRDSSRKWKTVRGNAAGTCRSAVHNLREARDDVLMSAIRDVSNATFMKSFAKYYETDRERERITYTVTPISQSHASL